MKDEQLYKIHGCKVDLNDQVYRVSESEAQFFTVYEIHDDGTSHALEDFDTIQECRDWILNTELKKVK